MGTIGEPTFQTQSCCARHTFHVIGCYTLIEASVVHITPLDFQAEVFTVNDELLAGFDLVFFLSLIHVIVKGELPVTMQANSAVEPLTTSREVSSSRIDAGSEITK